MVIVLAKKIYNIDGTTKKIVVKHDTGAYSSYTPKQAAQMILLLQQSLWNGVPLRKWWLLWH